MKWLINLIDSIDTPDTWLGSTLFVIGLAGAITLVMTVLALAWVGLLHLIA